MKVWVENSKTKQHELEMVTIKEDPWAWANACGLMGLVIALAFGACYMAWF